jgi:hypothetical protein
MKKIIVAGVGLLALSAILAATLTNDGLEAKLKAYYSGDSLEFKGQTIVASTNTGRVELFVLENGQLAKKSSFGFNGDDRTGHDGFYDVAMKYEGSKLYAFLVDGYWLYQYDITNLSQPVLKTKIHDNSWDWFLGVRVVNGGVVTIGTKGVKLYNSKLEVIKTYAEYNQHQYGIQIDWAGKTLVNILDQKVKALTTAYKQLFEQAIASKESHGRKPAILSDRVAVIDDKYISVYSLDNRLLKQVEHKAKFGYDIVASADERYYYATVGSAILKLDAETLEIIKRVDTSNFVTKEGWAMGLKRAGNRLTVWNGSSLVVLDQNLRFLGGTKATAEAIKPHQGVSIKLGSPNGLPESPLRINGTNFGYNETVNIDFAGRLSSVQTDDDGSFSTMVYVPSVKQGAQLINFTGAKSAIKYQVSFIVN